MGKSIGVKCPRGLIKHEDCRACALTTTRPCHLTPDILEKLRTTERDLPPRMYTPTMLLGCDRHYALSVDSQNHYTDIENAWPMLRGSMVHSLMENEATNYPGAELAIREVRLSTPISTAYGTFQFAGKPDLVVIRDISQDKVASVDIIDYKSTGEIKHDKIAASPEHQMQVNMYAWLVQKELPAYLADDRTWPIGIAPYLVEHVEINSLQILYADMKKTRLFISDQTRTDKGKLINRSPREHETLTLEPIHLLEADEIEQWIKMRIEDMERAQEVLPPVLPEESRWMCLHCQVKEACEAKMKEGL
jgi:hypothetical protein